LRFEGVSGLIKGHASTHFVSCTPSAILPMNAQIYVAVCALGLAAAPLAAAESSDQKDFFEQRVRPVLVARCQKCHGPERQESGLRLDSREALLVGGDSGERVVVPADPANSLLLQAIRYDGYEMPPDGKLSDREIADLTEWVAMGMPWPSSAAAPEALGIEQQAVVAAESHWAFQPIERPSLPAVHGTDWVTTGMDRFVLARLEANELEPSPEADRRTLIRRLNFDLLGLPPSPDDVAAFVADASPDAYLRLVDRLLASPRYGERWGRHWLDVARYADTRGYAFGRERRYPYAYTYRDYVINAFNADRPYDQFVVEQLAADLLGLAEDHSSLAALGFLTVGRKFNNRHDDIDDQIDVTSRGLLGLTVACARCHNHKYDAIPTADYYSLYGIFASSEEPSELPLLGNPEEQEGYAAFQKELDKRRGELDAFRTEKHKELLDKSRRAVTEYVVRALSSQPESLLEKLPFISLGRDELKPKLVDRWRAFLKDRLRPDDSVFGPLHDLRALPAEPFAEAAAAVLDRWRAVPVGTDPGQLNPLVRQALADSELASPTDAIALYGRLLTQVYEQRSEQPADAQQPLTDVPPAERQLLEILLAPGSPTDIALDDLDSYLNRAERNRQRELERLVQSHQAISPGAPPRAMVVAEKNSPFNPHIFIRGNHARRGKPVPRQYLLVLAGPDRKPFQQGSGRLELAREIASSDNPLTRRVIVNRLWMHHFETPLVETPSDFGERTDPPVHRELLDYLAARLLESGWSLKELHREIVTSSTYRQSSSTADAAPSDGGNRVAKCQAADPENRLYWRMNRRRLEFESMRDALLAAAGRLDVSMGGRPFELFGPKAEPRRSIYGFIDRQDLLNVLRVFDFASPDQSQAKRPSTTVPQQALFLMNSPFVIDQARALATRTEMLAASSAANTPDDTARRIEIAYELLFSRAPTAEEIEVGRTLVNANGGAAEGGLSAWEQYLQLLLMANEFMFVD